VVIELAPSLAVMVFGVLPTAELVEAVPTAVWVALAVPVEIAAVAVPIVVGIALVAPEEIVAEIVPIVAAASIGSVGVPVVAEERQLARRELFYRCECAARCIMPQGSPML